jgi:ribosomal protein S6--L-glutamate ligase
MILSFHPCFSGDRQIFCAGRAPGESDLAAIRAANAVILPQGCGPALYRMARENCRHVFPNFDARFAYPGKSGQARLFRRFGAAHPETEAYVDADAFIAACSGGSSSISRSFPFVFKFDWGGEGRNVIRIRSPEALASALATARRYERTGQKGFLVQEYVPSGNRVLRVAMIGSRTATYWRVMADRAADCANLAMGGEIDTASDPGMQRHAARVVRGFCRATGINLAGFDILVPERAGGRRAVFLEINYFFGRRGLGGSRAYYGMLIAEIERWISTLDRRGGYTDEASSKQRD